MHNIRFLLVAVSLLAVTDRCWAIGPVRCNGMIQYRPCDDNRANGQYDNDTTRSSSTKPHTNPDYKIHGTRYAKVIKSSFAPISKSEGMWQGTIQGNGFVELRLILFRNGAYESERYMGGVWLVDKRTPFKFKSSLPAGKDGKEWTWNIAASAS